MIIPDNTKLISLTQGKFAIVDAEDFEKLNQFKWYYDHNGYAVRRRSKVTSDGKLEYMHLFLFYPNKVKRIAGELLDNRKSNFIVNQMIIKDNIAYIPLTKGKYAMIDAEDISKIENFEWHCSYGYAVNKSGKQAIRMHNLIIESKEGMIIDHINGVRSDNRKANLRLCNYTENSINSIMKSNNTSGFKGVHYDKQSGKWRVEIKVNKTKKYIGGFAKKEEAAKAYDEAALKYHGEFAKTNKMLGLL